MLIRCQSSPRRSRSHPGFDCAEYSRREAVFARITASRILDWGYSDPDSRPGPLKGKNPNAARRSG
ncbi:hypothetical protein NG791_17575 [Laspinema sp. D1]|nr:hypothetical protein [Laspinema sp. D2b]